MAWGVHLLGQEDKSVMSGKLLDERDSGRLIPIGYDCEFRSRQTPSGRYQWDCSCGEALLTYKFYNTEHEARQAWARHAKRQGKKEQARL